MTTETSRLAQQVRESLDRPEQDRQAMAGDMLRIFEKNKALFQRLNALAAIQELAAQLNQRGFFAEVSESPPHKTKPKDTWGGYLHLDELRYKVGIKWGVKDESERHIYEVVGMAYDSGEIVSFGHQNDENRGYNPLSARGMDEAKFADLLVSEFLLGTKAKEVL